MERIRVTASNMPSVLEEILASPSISFDTETTGLRAYHGDAPFIVTICNGKKTWYARREMYGNKGTLDLLMFQVFVGRLYDYRGIIVAHNAKFDMHQEAALYPNLGPDYTPFKNATVICSRATARLVYNDHNGYSLDDCAGRIGFKKDDTVKKWITENKAFEWKVIPGKKARKRLDKYWLVPEEIMFEYACIDAEITWELGQHQAKEIEKVSADAESKSLPSLRAVLKNEARLTKTLMEMERYGIRIDPAFTLRSAQHEDSRSAKACSEFRELTGRELIMSPKLFREIFASDRDKWQFTDKNNPSFTSDVLANFTNPAAVEVLKYRDAKSRSDFLYGFLYHQDENHLIHPNFNQDGTASGRQSSSDPNFQNLTNEAPKDCARCGAGADYVNEEKCGKCGHDKWIEHDYMIRKCIVPRSKERVLLSFDYNAMEYGMMLELTARFKGYEPELLKRVRAGEDVHKATAEMASKYGVSITRQAAKMCNFLTIYGGGPKKLAAGLGCSLEEAQKIRNAIKMACPEMHEFIRAVIQTAEARGFVFNWFGRRSYFPHKDFAYRAPNYLIQGGCADVMKIAMNDIQDWLKEQFKDDALMIMTIHDELVFDVSKAFLTGGGPQKIVEFMVKAFPATYLPLSVSASIGKENLAELEPYLVA